MTITVAILVSDGIVLAADSRQVSLSALGQLRVDSDSAEKIIPLGSHMAAMIGGQSHFYQNFQESPRHISTLLRAGVARLPKDSTVLQTAKDLQQVVIEGLTNHKAIAGVGKTGGSVFHLAGYDTSVGRVYRCEVPGEVTLERETTDAGAIWGGQREIIDRLVLGWDSRLSDFLTQSNDSREVQAALLPQWPKLQLHLSFQTMTLQDAAALAELLATVTVRLQQVSDGIVGKPGFFPTCGGPVDVAMITPGEGFYWLRHKLVAL